MSLSDKLFAVSNMTLPSFINVAPDPVISPVVQLLLQLVRRLVRNKNNIAISVNFAVPQLFCIESESALQRGLLLSFYG